MAKRFSDSEKWKKPFIRALDAPCKLLWLYILDECDHAGIWQVDFDVAELKIGIKLNQEEALKNLGEKIVLLEDGKKWFIPDFIIFQYGELDPKNRVHNSAIKILDRNNIDLLTLKIKERISPLQGVKDKYMDKDKDKDEGGVGETEYPKVYAEVWDNSKPQKVEITDKKEFPPAPIHQRLVVEKKELVNQVAVYFGFTETANFDKIRIIHDFLGVLTHTGKDEYFEKQITAYAEYKRLSEEIKHSFSNFIGTAKELYLDGGWNAENWEDKLATFKQTHNRNRITAHSGGKKTSFK